MFSKKFNPDIQNLYDNTIKKRTNDKFQLKNIPYKNIINDENKDIKSVKDLNVKVHKDLHLEDKYNTEIQERKIKSVKKINNPIKFNDEIVNYDKNEFNSLKESYNTKFIEEQKDLENIKNNYNTLIESLINDGLLD